MTMPAPSESGTELSTYARRCHPGCIACREVAAGGLGLAFRRSADGGVEADFACGHSYQSYPDRVHGGIVALLLDAAMTHCLFDRGLHGVTARLNIRYRGPAQLGVTGVVRARLKRSVHGLHELEAEFRQSGEARASAEARFAERPNFDEG